MKNQLLAFSCAVVLLVAAACGNSEPRGTVTASSGGSRGGTGGASAGGASATGGVTSTGTQASAHASANGSIKGVPFVATGGATRRFYWTGDALVDGGPVQGAMLAGVSIAIGDYTNLCTAVRDTARPILEFYLRAATAELAPGTFPLVNSPVEGGTDAPAEGTLNYFVLYTDACSVSNQDSAVSGSVVLTRVTSTRIEGTFTATLETSGAISGDFALNECASAKPYPDDSDPTLACGVF